MKKLLISAALLIVFSATKAQINKGQWLAGGNVSFSSSKTGDFKESQFSFSPDAGYFFMNNFAGGLRLGFGTEKTDLSEDARNTFSVAPFVRYYFLPAAQKVNIFADASYGFGSVKEGDNKTNISGFGIMAGPAIFLSPNTALEFTLGYQSMKVKDADDATNSFGVNVGFQVHLGK